MRKGIRVTAARDLPYGIYRGHGQSAEIVSIEKGTLGTVTDICKHTTTIAFVGHEQPYHVATVDAAFAVSRSLLATEEGR